MSRSPPALEQARISSGLCRGSASSGKSGAFSPPAKNLPVLSPLVPAPPVCAGTDHDLCHVEGPPQRPSTWCASQVPQGFANLAVKRAAARAAEANAGTCNSGARPEGAPLGGTIGQERALPDPEDPGNTIVVSTASLLLDLLSRAMELASQLGAEHEREFLHGRRPSCERSVSSDLFASRSIASREPSEPSQRQVSSSQPAAPRSESLTPCLDKDRGKRARHCGGEGAPSEWQSEQTVELSPADEEETTVVLAPPGSVEEHVLDNCGCTSYLSARSVSRCSHSSDREEDSTVLTRHIFSEEESHPKSSHEMELREVWRKHEELVNNMKQSLNFEVAFVKSRRTTVVGTMMGSMVNAPAAVAGGESMISFLAWLSSVTMVHPGSNFRLLWCLITVFAIVCDSVLIPLQAYDIWDDAPSYVTMEWLGTVFWTCDLLLSFRTGYFKSAAVEMRPRHVAERYAKTWLGFDLVIVAVEWGNHFTTTSASAALLKAPRTVRAWRMVKAFKLLRLAKVRDIWNAIEERVTSNIVQLCMTLAGLTLVLMMAVHGSCCAWFAVGETDSGWVTYEAFPGHKDTFFWYVTSMRWAISQLNGRTDMDERRTVLERGFTVFIGVFLAVICKALFTAVVTKTILDISALANETLLRKRQMNEYLEQHKVPNFLTSVVKRYLKDLANLEKETTKERRVLELLPNSVKADLLHAVRGPRFAHHPLFNETLADFPEAVRQFCSVAITPFVVIEGEVIFDRGDQCRRMLVLEQGVLVYGDPIGVGIRTTHPGQRPLLVTQATFHSSLDCLRGCTQVTEGMFVSEAALWCNWTNMGNLAAEGACRLLSVDAEVMAQTVMQHKAAYVRVAAYAARFVDEMRKYQRLTHTELDDLAPFELLMCKAEPDERKYRVSIFGAKDVSEASQPYSVCQIHGHPQHTPYTRFRTQTVGPGPDPVWNHTAYIKSSSKINGLQFQLWGHQRRSDTLLGSVVLERQLFIRGCFDGELQLTGCEASIMVRVEPV